MNRPLIAGLVVGAVALLAGGAVAGNQLTDTTATTQTECSPPSGPFVLNQIVLDSPAGSDRTAANSSTPFFDLDGDGNHSSYAVSIDGISIGSFTSDTFANVCIKTTTPLVDGPHTLTATETAPNASNQIPPYPFTVDTIAPVAPSRPILASYSDCPFTVHPPDPRCSDNVTDYTNPALIGTASSDSKTVQLSFTPPDGTGGGAVSSGAWTVKPTPLKAGTSYTVTATAQDSAGNVSAASPSYAFSIAGTAPTTTTTRPTTTTTSTTTTSTSTSTTTTVAPTTTTTTTIPLNNTPCTIPGPRTGFCTGTFSQ